MKLRAVDVSLKSKKGLEEVTVCNAPLQFLAWLRAYIGDSKMLQCKTKKKLALKVLAKLTSVIFQLEQVLLMFNSDLYIFI